MNVLRAQARLPPNPFENGRDERFPTSKAGDLRDKIRALN
jgi:hypothetical protein